MEFGDKILKKNGVNENLLGQKLCRKMGWLISGLGCYENEEKNGKCEKCILKQREKVIIGKGKRENILPNI